MDTSTLLSDRARSIDASGIRRVFELAAGLRDPINLSIGQPDFQVPHALKKAAIDAINHDQNGYTLTQGSPALRERIAAHLKHDVGWSCSLKPGDGPGVMVTSGTSGALHLAFMSLLSPGDEVVIPDPYFVSYPELATMCGAKAVLCDTYPDFRITAERVEPLLTARTKAVLYCSPSNPAGVALSADECRDLLELCRSRGVLLIADEIYDEFAFREARTQPAAGDPHHLRCPSPARFQGSENDVLLVRGFGKTYGCTGWRLGYAAGPAPVLGAMTKLQQYTFVCAPSPLQASAIAAFDTDMRTTVAAFETRRSLVVGKLSPVTDLVTPDGAFYAFVRVPERLGMTASAFFEKCLEHNVLMIPGHVFSKRDTHFRISFATPDDKLKRGLEVLAGLMG
ncbi:MAG: aminotransferase class I/II-fold pyridoxal phosphate-dependent enzyme [Phycisphaeraceae bacterium]|nr:MAG: aminotransferase class I/II-fold pyridoxal phosphate-dependent enzyme [Phycisphaeraceae bacterium]